MAKKGALVLKSELISKEDGVTVFNIAATEESDDWLRAGRLKELALKGDKEAAAELERMAETPTYVMKEGDETD